MEGKRRANRRKNEEDDEKEAEQAKKTIFEERLFVAATNKPVNPKPQINNQTLVFNLLAGSREQTTKKTFNPKR